MMMTAREKNTPQAFRLSTSGAKSPKQTGNVYKKILGAGFRGTECILTVMTLDGKILSKENISIDLIKKLKGKNVDFERIAGQIDEKTQLKKEKFDCAGVAVPEKMVSLNERSPGILAKGLKDIFKCKTFFARESTAAGYGEKECGGHKISGDMIYMHSDTGIGTVIKDGMILEAGEEAENGKNAYLKPWNQFDLVESSKKLIKKGIGTDIVELAHGDLDNIKLDTVLEAADKKDELASDLVKRSALALGVRAAYLVNLFDTGNILLGGGIETKQGNYAKSVKESAEKFVLKKNLNKLKIIPGVLGKKASSIGAAAMCRRELFLEA